jgi:hypothetical protein
MADEIIRLDYSAEDIGDNIDEVRTARGTYESLDERLDEIEGGGFTPTQAQLDAMNSTATQAKIDQIQTNKNNILWNTQNGVKNVLDFANMSRAGGSPTVTVTKTDDEITVSSPTSTWVSVAYTLPILPSGVYTFSAIISDFSRSGGDVRIMVAKTVGGQQQVGGISLTANGKIAFNFGSSGEQLYLLYYPNYSGGNYANSFTASQNMLCLKPLYDSDSSYQSYAMSSAELTAAIQALQAQLANQ